MFVAFKCAEMIRQEVLERLSVMIFQINQNNHIGFCREVPVFFEAENSHRIPRFLKEFTFVESSVARPPFNLILEVGMKQLSGGF